MTDRERYQRAVKSIQQDLTKYSYVSFVEHSILYLSTDLGQDNFRKQPWIIALALKWSCLHGKDGKREIDQTVFLRFCNRIYRLQAYAAEFDINSGNGLLVLRPLFLNQYWYQKPSEDGLLYLARCHKLMCNKPVAQNYIAQEFQKQIGLSLDNFFRMALVLTKTLFLLKSTTFVDISLADVIYKFHPTIPLEEVEAFIQFVVIDIRALPAFFESYSMEKLPTSEYFETTPLSYKPFIYFNMKLTALSPKVAINGLTELITDFFIKNDAKRFVKNFSSEFEHYVDGLFASSSLSSISEDAIDTLYKENAIEGKKVDFLIEGQTPVFIDAKAIQPNKVSLLSSANRNLYRDKLKSSFLKGFWQAQECRALLNQIGYCKSDTNFGLVVTHKDFYFVSAKKYSELIDDELEKSVLDKFGYVPIPLDRIYFLTVKDLEDLLALHNQGIDVIAILERIYNDEKTSEGRRMNFQHHLADAYDRRFRRHETVSTHFDELSRDAVGWLEASKSTWNDRIGSLIQTTQIMNNRLDMAI